VSFKNVKFHTWNGVHRMAFKHVAADENATPRYLGRAGAAQDIG
jgi:hypothetical protein